MNINLVCPVIVLDNELNPDIRKNDVKKLKLLVTTNNELVKVNVNNKITLKDNLKSRIKNITNTEQFHLEQVYTLGEENYYFDNSIDIIYLAITNSSYIKKIDSNYKLVDFSIKNSTIVLDNNSYDFKTVERISNNNVEYIHKISAQDKKLEKELLEILIAYKHLRGRLSQTSDIIFKFMGKTFTLEDVRIVYEMIKEVQVDKSNFRKKIVNYCEEVALDPTKKGHRPSKMYKFKIRKGDIWL